MQSIIFVLLFFVYTAVFLITEHFNSRAQDNMLEKTRGCDLFTKYNGNSIAFVYKKNYVGLFNAQGLRYIGKVRKLLVVQLIIAFLFIGTLGYQS